MPLFRNIILIVFTLLLVSEYVFSLTCYSCSDCGDPFDSKGVMQIVMNSSDLYCKKTKGANIVDRNITQQCMPFTAVGNGVHCCQTDLCNDAQHILPINSFAVVFIASVIIKFI